MQLTLQIDDALLQEAARLGGTQTPQVVILDALREYIRHRRPPGITRNTAAPAWVDWMAASNELAVRILRRREGRPLELDTLLAAAKEDLEQRHDEHFSH